MKNNKGFAVTTVVYSILILLTLFMFTILSLYKNEYKNQKDFINNTKIELNDYLIEEYTPKDTNPPSCNLKVNDKDSVTKTLIIESNDVDLDEEPYSFDGIIYSGINTKDITTAGTYNAYVRDLSGNVSSVCSAIVTFDDEKPTISLTSASGSITATMKDNVGVVGYAITTTSTEPTSWTSISSSKEITKTFSNLTAGTYYVYAKDEANNVGHNSINVVVDTTGPTITLSTSGGVKTATIRATISDPSGVSYYAITSSTATPTSWTSVSNSPTTTTAAFTKTSAGTYYVHAKDSLGNKGYQKVTLSLSQNSYYCDCINQDLYYDCFTFCAREGCPEGKNVCLSSELVCVKYEDECGWWGSGECYKYDSCWLS